MARIPLRARDGSVRAWALVDDADAGWVNQWSWSLNKGYVHRCERVAGRRRKVYLHRALLGLSTGDRGQVDHLNRDRLDNRRSNLLVVSQRLNAQNLASRPGTSRFRGVHWDPARQCWIASAYTGGVKLNLGGFDDELVAAAVAAEHRAVHMPHSDEARAVAA